MVLLFLGSPWCIAMSTMVRSIVLAVQHLIPITHQTWKYTRADMERPHHPVLPKLRSSLRHSLLFRAFPTEAELQEADGNEQDGREGEEGHDIHYMGHFLSPWHCPESL